MKIENSPAAPAVNRNEPEKTEKTEKAAPETEEPAREQENTDRFEQDKDYHMTMRIGYNPIGDLGRLYKLSSPAAVQAFIIGMNGQIEKIKGLSHFSKEDVSPILKQMKSVVLKARKKISKLKKEELLGRLAASGKKLGKKKLSEKYLRELRSKRRARKMQEQAEQADIPVCPRRKNPLSYKEYLEAFTEWTACEQDGETAVPAEALPQESLTSAQSDSMPSP